MVEKFRYTKYRRFWQVGLLGAILWSWGVICAGAAEQEKPSVQNPGAVRMQQITELPVVRTVSMDVHYKIERVLPEDLARVELWYGRGPNGAWELYEFDQDLVSPVRFVAPGEGVFRFLIVAVDRWGRRSSEIDDANRIFRTEGAPQTITAHMTVFVDYTAPRLYLYNPRGELFDYRQEQIDFRWAGFDNNPDATPVRIYYQQLGSTDWTPISGALKASGEFSWRIPPELTGPIITRAVLVDRAGNMDVQYSGIIHLSRDRKTEEIPLKPREPNEVKVLLAKEAPAPAAGEEAAGGAGSASLSREVQRQAAQCILRGNLYIQRREWPEAARAFEEALLSDSGSIEARINLANVFFQMGEFEKTQQQYEMCLQIDSSFQAAWYGLAQAQIARQEYAEAQKSLGKLLEMDEEDWQGWLLHGNVSEHLGQAETARASWLKAAHKLSPVKELAEEALERIKGGLK